MKKSPTVKRFELNPQFPTDCWIGQKLPLFCYNEHIVSDVTKLLSHLYCHVYCVWVVCIVSIISVLSLCIVIVCCVQSCFSEGCRGGRRPETTSVKRRPPAWQILMTVSPHHHSGVASERQCLGVHFSAKVYSSLQLTLDWGRVKVNASQKNRG